MDKFQKLFKEYSQKSPSERAETFWKYAKEVIDLKETENQTVEMAAYHLCGCITFDELTAIPEIDDVIDLSCDLEIQDEFRFTIQEKQEKWEVVKQEVLKHLK